MSKITDLLKKQVLGEDYKASVKVEILDTNPLADQASQPRRGIPTQPNFEETKGAFDPFAPPPPYVAEPVKQEQAAEEIEPEQPIGNPFEEGFTPPATPISISPEQKLNIKNTSGGLLRAIDRAAAWGLNFLAKDTDLEKYRLTDQEFSDLDGLFASMLEENGINLSATKTFVIMLASIYGTKVYTCYQLGKMKAENEALIAEKKQDQERIATLENIIKAQSNMSVVK